MTDLLKTAVSNGVPIAAGVLGFFRPLDASKLAGGLLTFGGLYGWFNPVPLGKVFGIPFSDQMNTLFLPGIGGRNMAAGITTLTLSTLASQASAHAEGYRRSLGIFLATWTLAGFSDSWILLQTEGSDNLGTHLFNIVVLSVISFRLIQH